MKKFLAILTAVLVIALNLAACNGSTGYSNNLGNLDGNVSSNGGFAVVKGDYVYFVNGIAAYTDDNTYGNVAQGALVRVKKADLANTKNANAELVIPSLFVAGNTTAGFYMYKDGVYYATPCSTQNKAGVVENSKLDFKKTSLDGKTSVDILTVSDRQTQYRYVQAGDVVYLVIETKNADSEDVLAVYNADTGAKVYETEKLSEVVFSEDLESATFFYTKAVHDEDLDKDEDYNEVYCLKVANEVSDELVLTGKGKMAVEGQEGFIGITGAKFSFVKDTADYLYIKSANCDTTIVSSNKYLALKKSDIKGGSENASANYASALVLNNGTSEASSVFASTSLYLNPNCIVYLDSTYGLLKYDYSDNSEAGSHNRFKLTGDADLSAYTVKFYDNGYIYLTDSNNLYYRINLSALLAGGEFDSEKGVEKVNFIANGTGWYAPEVIDNYLLSVYTAEPYNSFVFVSDMSANANLSDDEIETIQKLDRDSILKNLESRIAYLTDDMKQSITDYMDEKYPVKEESAQ